MISVMIFELGRPHVPKPCPIGTFSLAGRKALIESFTRSMGEQWEMNCTQNWKADLSMNLLHPGPTMISLWLERLHVVSGQASLPRENPKG